MRALARSIISNRSLTSRTPVPISTGDLRESTEAWVLRLPNRLKQPRQATQVTTRRVSIKSLHLRPLQPPVLTPNPSSHRSSCRVRHHKSPRADARALRPPCTAPKHQYRSKPIATAMRITRPISRRCPPQPARFAQVASKNLGNRLSTEEMLQGKKRVHLTKNYSKEKIKAVRISCDILFLKEQISFHYLNLLCNSTNRFLN